jgi:chromosome segregation ATPase
MAILEDDVKDLQAKRKILAEVTRALELQVFQEQRRATPQTASVAKRDPASRTIPVQQANSVSAVDSLRKQYESLNRRLDSAKSVSQKLEEDSRRLEEQLQSRFSERAALASLHETLSKEVADLERHETIVSGVVRESKEVIRKSGSYASRLPYLEKRSATLEEVIAATKADFQATQATLTTLIDSDDRTLTELRRFSVNSVATVMPSLIRQLQTENELLQRLAHAHVEEADRNRMSLQQNADRLQERLQGIEDKIRSALMRCTPNH